jgi:hypothetical protein
MCRDRKQEHQEQFWARFMVNTEKSQSIVVHPPGVGREIGATAWLAFDVNYFIPIFTGSLKGGQLVLECHPHLEFANSLRKTCPSLLALTSSTADMLFRVSGMQFGFGTQVYYLLPIKSNGRL